MSPEHSINSDTHRKPSDNNTIYTIRSKPAWTKHCGKRCMKLIKDNLLLLTTAIGVLLGFAIGFIVRAHSPSETTLLWIGNPSHRGLPGQLYIRLFKMLIVPLIVCSVIGGSSSLDPKSNGKISLVAFVFIVCSNGAGSALGIGFSVLLNPGVNVTAQHEDVLQEHRKTTDIIVDLILNVVPDNLFEAAFSKTQSEYRTVERVIGNRSNETQTITEKYTGKTDSPNILGLIFACTLFGIAASKLGDRGKPFLVVIQSTSYIVLMVLKWFVWTTPVGVVSSIAVSVAALPDLTIVLKQMGMFVAVVTASVVTFQLVVMPTVLFLITRKNPFSFLISIAHPWMIAFATTTTAKAIPEMLQVCEDRNNIDKRVSGFVIPFSVSISCAGGALYIAAATIFVANISGTEISVKDYILLWILASMAAMAIPSVPSASLVTALMVMTSLSIEIDDIALLLAMEWLVDRIRITCSVVSHTFCAATVDHICKKDLKPQDIVTESDDSTASSDSLSDVSASTIVS